MMKPLSILFLALLAIDSPPKVYDVRPAIQFDSKVYTEKDFPSIQRLLDAMEKAGMKTVDPLAWMKSVEHECSQNLGIKAYFTVPNVNLIYSIPRILEAHCKGDGKFESIVEAGEAGK